MTWSGFASLASNGLRQVSCWSMLGEFVVQKLIGVAGLVHSEFCGSF